MLLKLYLPIIGLAMFLPLEAAGRECSLTISVAGLGSEVPPYKVGYFRSVDGRDEVGRFKGLRGEALPCGRYTFELLRSDVETDLGRISREIVLEDSSQRLTLQADRTLAITPRGISALEMSRSTSYVLHGQLKGLSRPDVASTWVRLLAITTNVAREVNVTAEGMFEFYSPWPDSYVLLVLQPGRMLAARYLVVTGRLTPTAIEIDLTPP